MRRKILSEAQRISDFEKFSGKLISHIFPFVNIVHLVSQRCLVSFTKCKGRKAVVKKKTYTTITEVLAAFTGFKAQCITPEYVKATPRNFEAPLHSPIS